MSAMFFILSQLILSPVIAATFEAPVQEGDRLLLKGFEAQVQFVAQPGSKTVRVSGVEESSVEGIYTISKKNNLIEIRMNEYDDKKTLLGHLSKSPGTKKIEISGLPLAAEVQLRAGSVSAQKWNKDLKISLTQGRVTSTGGVGTLQVYLQKGEVNIQDHTGRVDTDSYSGNTRLTNIQGDVTASAFSGQLQIENVRGFLNINAQQSAAKVSQGSGTLQFESGKGSVNIQSFLGRIEGQNQEASVTVNMALDTDLDIRSKSGRVTVATPAQSGMNLNLRTVDGEIQVPAPLRVTRLSAEKTVRGRLRGDAQKGSVLVRSQDGSISVK